MGTLFSWANARHFPALSLLFHFDKKCLPAPRKVICIICYTTYNGYGLWFLGAILAKNSEKWKVTRAHGVRAGPHTGLRGGGTPLGRPPNQYL